MAVRGQVELEAEEGACADRHGRPAGDQRARRLQRGQLSGGRAAKGAGDEQAFQLLHSFLKLNLQLF